MARRFLRGCNPEPDESVESWLARIFERAQRVAVVTGLLAQGCTTEPTQALAEPGDTDAIDETGSAQVAGGVPCAPGATMPISASGLSPARRFDYLAIRTLYGTPAAEEGPERWTQSNFSVVSEVGTTCATATTRECHQKIRMHPEPFRRTSCLQLCTETSVVTTAGDEVRRWAGIPELVSLLGPIDTPDEALLLVEAAGYDLTCNNAERTTVRAARDGFIVTATKITRDCAPIITTRFTLRVFRSGEIQEVRAEEIGRDSACIGRVPAGLTSAAADEGRSPLGDYLARAAHLEAASVIAFERLAAELCALGAPASLVHEARRAAEDEVRHADVVSALAQARGGAAPVPPRVEEQPLRALLALALENAVEGCVRETFGALVGAHQARRAADAELAAAMREIAADEARHAALSWKVHIWAMEQLGPEERAHVQEAQADALSRLAASTTHAPAPEVAHAAGLPGPTEAACLLDVLREGIQTPVARREAVIATSSP
ncbi:ferritin-like domain-containing protein [Polyangium sp. y55x31]|uniref:ferritin-like domain-containing protein n=1 Tax=Polyangium sp. y55x31 TaxID=3042688 RepID=UPI0024826C6A|nr:ferritin-like domain-containing protein [Polyangium sp. y55x31]MDI1482563.1 ferritin-like domain-containing protein [Polyangium sp. y55x31]